MPDSFDLLVWADSAALPAGDHSVILSETGKLRPPEWAGGFRMTSSPGDYPPDAALIAMGERPSAEARSLFFSLFRRSVPVGALVYGEPSYSDPVFSKLREWNRCWTYSGKSSLASLVHNSVQEWLQGINRGLSSYPSGEELIRSWNGVAGDSVDRDSLLNASSILRDRGFVCLSGPLGAGKTTLARLLLMGSADEGLVPMELIDDNIVPRNIERKLRGPEDCALLFDIDLIRRQIDINPLHLFHSALTIILRATDARRRVVLISSDPRIAGLFSLFGGAHVVLPSPETNRQWRIEQGQRALSTFKDMDLFSKAELVLLSLFEPIVSETVFRASLQEVWSRLHFLLRETFPSQAALDSMYDETSAATGEAPFRRLYIDGKLHLCSGDTLILRAVDEGLAELSGGGSPLIRVVMETLLNSGNPQQRKAGYSIAHMYSHLSSSEKSRLLFTASREPRQENLTDFFSMLVSRRESFDRAAEGLCRHILESGSVESRRALAVALGNPWLRKDRYFRELVESAASDPDELVRGYLLQSIDMWGMAGDPGGFVDRFLDDGSPVVRSRLLFLLGRRFPGLSERELEVVNETLTAGREDEMENLIQGLMNRQLGEFGEESCDLLWLLMQRLPNGGRGIIAYNIGARIRFFDPLIREALFTGVAPGDTRIVAQCMLMNYEDLSPAEKETLWKMIADMMPRTGEMAAMVLPYIRMLDAPEQDRLLRITLTSEGYGGREALSQLLAGGREDLAGLTLNVVFGLIDNGTVEERSRLPWFLLWNRESFGPRAAEALGTLVVDRDPTVRKAMAFGIRRLGFTGENERYLLERLSMDAERSVRAAAGEALAEFSSSGELNEGVLKKLSSDPDAFVRAGVLRGLGSSTGPTPEEKTRFFSQMLADREPSVRLMALTCLGGIEEIPEVPGLTEKLTSLLRDGSEEVRNAAVNLVTGHPSVTASRELREKLPDLYLGRLSGGDSIAEELNTARRIQAGLLPREAPRYENIDIAVHYSSAREVGGDYNDVFQLPDGYLGLAVADVAGKGIPAALTMAGMKGTLGASVRSLFDITQIMRRVNSELTVGDEISSLVGLFYGVLSTSTGVLTYCNAGHNPPLLITRSGDVSGLEQGGLLMGVTPEAEYSFGVAHMHPGDVLVLYTDGITETMNSMDEEFGPEKLAGTVLEQRDLNAEQILSRILAAVEEHSGGAPQEDDRTLMVVKHR